MGGGKGGAPHRIVGMEGGHPIELWVWGGEVGAPHRIVCIGGEGGGNPIGLCVLGGGHPIELCVFGVGETPYRIVCIWRGHPIDGGVTP